MGGVAGGDYWCTVDLSQVRTQLALERQLTNCSAANPTAKPPHPLPQQEDLERRCRINGLSNRGGVPAMVARLLALDLYLNAGEAAPPALPVPTPTGLFAASSAAGVALMTTTGAGAEAAAAAVAAGAVPIKVEEGGRLGGGAETVPAAVAQSRWTSVEEDDDSQQVQGGEGGSQAGVIGRSMQPGVVFDADPTTVPIHRPDFTTTPIFHPTAVAGAHLLPSPTLPPSLPSPASPCVSHPSPPLPNPSLPPPASPCV